MVREGSGGEGRVWHGAGAGLWGMEKPPPRSVNQKVPWLTHLGLLEPRQKCTFKTPLSTTRPNPLLLSTPRSRLHTKGEASNVEGARSDGTAALSAHPAVGEGGEVQDGHPHGGETPQVASGRVESRANRWWGLQEVAGDPAFVALRHFQMKVRAYTWSLAPEGLFPMKNPVANKDQARQHFHAEAARIAGSMAPSRAPTRLGRGRRPNEDRTTATQHVRRPFLHGVMSDTPASPSAHSAGVTQVLTPFGVRLAAGSPLKRKVAEVRRRR